MRLLTCDHDGNLHVTRDLVDDIPPYAILSHTWGPDEEEVTFPDLQQEQGQYEHKAGYQKLLFCAEQAKTDGIQYFWVDTCCIDKANNSELIEAITSMFRWYSCAQKCYVYLSDVSTPVQSLSRDTAWGKSIRASRWFTRGWTLQELLAPRVVEFYSSEGHLLGTKETLAEDICEITTIPFAALQGVPLSHFPISERIRWTEQRDTKKKEDKAYCLLGIFDVFMPLIYGEGENALYRLRREINERHGVDVAASLSIGHGTSVDPQPFSEPGLRNKHFGLCLGDAPQIDPEFFQGRAVELEEMQNRLQVFNSSTDRRCVVLGGIGGAGKTQLAIAFAQRHRSSYGSVFWLNATSEATLGASFRQVAGLIFEQQVIAESKDEELVGLVRQWLSQPDNRSWLMIFDNYDEPDVYEITKHYPITTHGSIIVTTRLPARVSGVHVSVEALHKSEDSLAILRTRSRRMNTASDPHAQRLAERLGGLPLALATAGAYLEHSSWSFQRYLEEYEKRWHVDRYLPTALPEYRNKTLYTTWDLSYRLLQTESPKAAQLLKLLAYFDNQNIRYDLFRSLKYSEQRGWRSKAAQKLLHRHKQSPHVQVAIRDYADFESLMVVLTQHCFVETKVETDSYTMHNCVHDWTLNSLNANVDVLSYLQAFDYVVTSIDPGDWEIFGHLSYAKLALHASRLTRSQFLEDRSLRKAVENRYYDAETIALLLKAQILLHAAERMFLRVLAGKEKALRRNHPLNFDTVHNLGSLYADQGNLDQAEQMYIRALAGYQKALGPNHTSTLSTVRNLGSLYADQGNLDQAEQMYTRALTIRGELLGPSHTSVLVIARDLGVVYRKLGKLKEAEQMFERALAGYEKTLKPDDTFTLYTVNSLGVLYHQQGKFKEAEQMFERALAGFEKVLGPHHISTLDTVHCLGMLCWSQGKLKEAEQMFKRALAGLERALGPNHTSTIETAQALRDLHAEESGVERVEEVDEAE